MQYIETETFLMIAGLVISVGLGIVVFFANRHGDKKFNEFIKNIDKPKD